MKRLISHRGLRGIWTSLPFHFLQFQESTASFVPLNWALETQISSKVNTGSLLSGEKDSCALNCVSECLMGLCGQLGRAACQRRGPVWVFICLLSESRQGNHISYGCTVTIQLLHRILNPPSSPSLPRSLWICIYKALCPRVLIRGGPERSHK